MKAKLVLIGGFLMAPICVFAFFWQWAGIWVLCPQALVVMFVRQWQHAYDSLGAVDYPDFAVATLYYPIVGWLLHRAVKCDKLRRASASVALLHIVAIGLAWATAEMRNRIWGIG